MINFDHDPTTLDRLYCSMSAHFLTEQLPDEAIDWTEDRVEKFVEDHAWEPLEYHDPKDVMEMIEAAARHAHEFFKQELLRLTCNK